MTEQPIKVPTDKVRNMLVLAIIQLQEDKDIAAALESLKAAYAHAVPERRRLARPEGVTLH